MPSLAQFLLLIALAVAPPGTHHIDISAASESYHWNLDDGDATYTGSQIQPYGNIPPHLTAEHPITTNGIVPDSYTSDENTTAQISSHDWDINHILKFDDYHQLEKNADGFVYAVHIGSPSQKLYSITFKP